MEVPGNRISDEEITAETPSFENIGPKKVKVVVLVGRGDYTITETDYQYFLNTDGAKCIAYGPGLLDTNCPNENTIFVI